jgi:hypothetical protein
MYELVDRDSKGHWLKRRPFGLIFTSGSRAGCIEKLRERFGFTEWSERKMLQQILFQVFCYFMLWSAVLSLQLLIGIFTYENSIYRATTNEIWRMTQESQFQLLETTRSHIEFSLGLQEQLTARHSIYITSLLDPNYGLPNESPVDHRSAPVVSYRNMQRYGYYYKYPVHHREPYQLNPRLTANIQKLSRIHEYLDAALTTPFGTGTDQRVYGSQFFFQLQRRDICLISFPPALNMPKEWTEVIDGYRTGDLTHHEMYRKALRQRKAIYNFIDYDLEYEKTQMLTIARPLLNGDTFWGVFFQEMNIYDLFEKTVVTSTFREKKYPLLQVI